MVEEVSMEAKIGQPEMAVDPVPIKEVVEEGSKDTSTSQPGIMEVGTASLMLMEMMTRKTQLLEV